MDPLKYRLETLCQESVVRPRYIRNSSPSRNHQEAKQSRKASTISLRDDRKTKRRTNQYRSSLVETTDQIYNVQRFKEACSLRSNDGDYLSRFETMLDGYEDKSVDAVEDFAQMPSDEEHIRQHLQEDESIDSKSGKNPEDGVNLTVKEKPKSSEEEEPKSVNLADKSAQNDAFDVIGIMNLSSMNLTDSDIPTVIERAFGQKKKKCFGLILRDNALTSEGVRILVDALLTIRINFKYLCLSDNPNIGDEGIEHLTRLLRKSRSMNFLAVPNTGMTDRGVQILADTLCRVDADSSCAPLEKLYISFNKSITDASLAAILQIIEHNRTLKLFALRHCSLSDTARQLLKQLGIKLKKRKFSLAE